jgi:hypothetical protein
MVKTSVSLHPLKININVGTYWLLVHLETFSRLNLLCTSSAWMTCHLEMMIKKAIVPYYKCSRGAAENHEKPASE